jgi:hypothetical protein
VRLEEAQDLLLGRHLLSFEYSADGLVDALLHQRHEALETIHEAPGVGIGSLA